MKKLTLTIALALTTVTAFACVNPEAETRIFVAEDSRDITETLPKIGLPTPSRFKKIPNVAQNKNADWDQVVGVARGISLMEAFKIAKKNDEITYFFYTKADGLVLETPQGDYRLFKQGDAVFFSGKPKWGIASELADGYVIKKRL